ncbi:MAG: sigma 54-interacting transcriptional regulator [Verrucomicrobiota bacterium]
MRLSRPLAGIVGRSRALREVRRQIRIVAPTGAAVLILGETGTGKEMAAQAVHGLSDRARRPLVRVNCAAIPAALLESDLFGHEKGAFTGAIAHKPGRLERADQGTLFLDEIGDFPLELQPKLLRVLQEKEFERVGSHEVRRVDARLITATSRDLQQMVAERRFRGDLYYRLNVFPLRIPPLRQRRADIAALAAHFLRRFAAELGKPTDTIPPEVLRALAAYAWPGNVRQLQNFIQRAVILSPGRTLLAPLDELEPMEASDKVDGQRVPSLREVERDHILEAVRRTRWLIGGPNGAAALLGLHRTTLQSRMRKLGISRGYDETPPG